LQHPTIASNKFILTIDDTTIQVHFSERKIDNFQIEDKHFLLEESPFLYAMARLKVGTNQRSRW